MFKFEKDPLSFQQKDYEQPMRKKLQLHKRKETLGKTKKYWQIKFETFIPYGLNKHLE